jgi:hypothetical protein
MQYLINDLAQIRDRHRIVDGRRRIVRRGARKRRREGRAVRRRRPRSRNPRECLK